MKCFKILVVVVGLAMCSLGWAEEEAADATPTTATAEKPAQKNTEGVGPIEDVQGVMNKAAALLSGDLEMKMELNKNRAPKDEYTYNALGQRVPKKTAIKTGSALHSE